MPYVEATKLFRSLSTSNASAFSSRIARDRPAAVARPRATTQRAPRFPAGRFAGRAAAGCRTGTRCRDEREHDRPTLELVTQADPASVGEARSRALFRGVRA